MAPIHLAVELDGAGWHPAAWREPGARPAELYTARHWAGLVAEAERGLLDFVSFADSFAADPHPGRIPGRLDAVLTAARIAPLTRGIGLVPTVTATHTEPFHVSKAVATLDFVSGGRAGLHVRTEPDPAVARHFGRRAFPVPEQDLAREAADHVEVVRRLWDSWEDDAEIRDTATGRFVDVERLHPVDFRGRWFSVRGPSITPRPPQGRPPVGAAAGTLAGDTADLVHLTPADTDEARDQAAALGARPAPPAHLFADLAVFLDTTRAAAADRLHRLDALAGATVPGPAAVFTGTPEELAALLVAWHDAGISGFRLRPGVHAHDLPALTRGLVPLLRAEGRFRREYGADTLRGLLGLPRAENRYATDRTVARATAPAAVAAVRTEGIRTA
ncbi:LLM class flavin-dependent oxidoreductase [Streptomyces sp. NPDC097619]|uniref:LLM class flavin-dependent oxidoreductase n=1 Tax=Streptomyces sp. NPDC097619 TaxID=3157228 RepID=UPI00331F0A4D